MISFLRKRAVVTTSPETPCPRASHAAVARHYQPELIAQLKAEHQHLLQLVADIKAGCEVANYAEVFDKLTELRTSLEAHLLIENAGLYLYLQHSLADDDTCAEVMRRFHSEMDAIGIAAMEFLNKYQAIGINSDLAPTFSQEFALISRILKNRIRNEELILYPLYLP